MYVQCPTKIQNQMQLYNNKIGAPSSHPTIFCTKSLKNVFGIQVFISTEIIINSPHIGGPCFPMSGYNLWSDQLSSKWLLFLVSVLRVVKDSVLVYGLSLKSIVLYVTVLFTSLYSLKSVKRLQTPNNKLLWNCWQFQTVDQNKLSLSFEN